MVAANPSRHTYTPLTGASAWKAGTNDGTVVRTDKLVMGTPTGTAVVGGVTYQTATWTSAWVTPGHTFTQLVPSWTALTPRGSWLKVSLRVKTAAGRVSSFDTVASWARGDKDIKRASAARQIDDLARIDVDTLLSNNARPLSGWQVQIRLFKTAKALTPVISTVGAVASRIGSLPGTSAPSSLVGSTLGVPAYSQMRHKGHYPAYGGGGEAWCSPTSVAMVLSYFHAQPDPTEWSWVAPTDLAPWVDNAARMTYDYRYQGTGNWSFNTAYAARTLPGAFVTRLTSMREAEQFLAAGIPLVASISFGAGELTGSPLRSSPGHLVVIIGTTSTGRVIVNDPAAATDTTVRRTYSRGQFERAWLGRSHGAVYVMHDAGHPLPAPWASTKARRR